MALFKPFVISTEGFHQELATADTLDVGSITINAAGTGIDAGSKKITSIADGTNPADGVNLAQVEALVATGNIFKEPVHAKEQLVDGATGGIAALEVIHFTAIPVVGDTVIFDDGTLTRTYTFVANIAGETLATDVSIETDAATAMARLTLRVNADVGNTAWDLYDQAAGETGVEVHVIERKTPVDAISTSRIYGVWTTQAEFQVVPFSDGTTAIAYNAGVAATAPAADPTDGRFGFSRGETTLVDGEVHLALGINAQFSWEDTAQVWNQISGVGAIPDATSGSGGGTKGISTYDSDKGLQVLTAGVAEVKLGTNRGIEFNVGGIGVKIASANELSLDANGLNVEGVPTQFKIGASATSAAVTAANLGTLTAGIASDAQSLHTHGNLSSTGHTHTHASTTGQGTDDHHNQVHAIDGGDHSLAGATTGHILTATSATTFAFQAPGAASEVPKVEDTVNTATDTTANGDPVYINGNDTYGKARADTDAKARVTGIIRTGGGAAPTAVEVVSHGPCTSVLGGGGVANVPYYLGVTGGISTSLPAGATRVIAMGYALNANDLFVRIVDYGKKAA